jgi:hypothetical protein
MKIVTRETTVSGQLGKGFYLEMDFEERRASERAQWKAGLVKVWREHPKGRAYTWMPAQERHLAEYATLGKIRECHEKEYLG